MMWKYLIIFWLNFLPMIYAPISPLTGNHEHTTQPEQILPLVLMKLYDDSEYIEIPTDLKENADKKSPEENSDKKSSEEIPHFHFISDTSDNDMYLCPAENEKQEKQIQRAINLLTEEDNDAFKLHKDCLLEKKFHRHESQQCIHEAVPVIAKVFETDGQDEVRRATCGADGNGKKYDFRYEFCVSHDLVDDIAENVEDALHCAHCGQPKFPFKGIHYVDMYEFCYLHEKSQTLYTYYLIRTPKLLENDRLRDEREKTFDMMTDGYEYFGSEFEKIKDAYIKAQQTSTLHINTNFYEPQTLTLPDDMPFALWRKTTYHFANVRPMHTKLVWLWEYLHRLIRLDAIKNEATYHVYTGAFQIPDRNTNEQYLFQGQVQIPEIWVTMAYDEKFTQGIAIVMYNYIDDVQPNYCTTNLCDFSQLHVLEDSVLRNKRYFHCCQIVPEIQQFFGTNINLDELKVMDIEIPVY